MILPGLASYRWLPLGPVDAMADGTRSIYTEQLLAEGFDTV